ncbi:MAG: STAS domain-containing protein [Terracidiphilus sp.]|jgi:anti-sigma B factor antagonist
MPIPATGSPLTLEIEPQGDEVIVRCHGQLIAGVSDVLYTPVAKLIPCYKRVVLDLADVAYMDSMGLGTLVRLYVHAKSARTELVLAHLGKRIRQLLGVTHLLSVFAVMGEQGIKIGF